MCLVGEGLLKVWFVFLSEGLEFLQNELYKNISASLLVIFSISQEKIVFQQHGIKALKINNKNIMKEKMDWTGFYVRCV